MVMRTVYSISCTYFLLLGMLGAMGPYLTKEMDGRSVANLSLLLSMPALIGLLVTPVWGVLADRYSRVRMWMVLAVLFILIGLCGLIVADGWVLYGAMFLYALGRAPLSPFLDAMALHVAKNKYGQLRLWGSIGFMVVLAGCAFLDDRQELSALYVALILGLVLLVTLFSLPRSVTLSSSNILESLPVFVRQRELMLLLAIAAMHFASHAANTSYLAMYIESTGASTLWTGAAISAGIVVEIVVLATSAFFYRRFTLFQLFVVAAGIALLRWVAMYFASGGLWITICQSTHGLTFGLFWIAVVPWVETLSPANLKNTGQALLSAAVGGIGVGLGVYIGTHIFEAFSLRDIYIFNSFLSLSTLLALWFLCRPSSTNVPTPSS